MELNQVLNKGDINEKYHLEGELGSGINKVCLGVNYETSQEYAIKIINMVKMNNNDKQAVFQELMILSEVDHPNIVNFIEAFEDHENGLFFMVFELLKGGNLLENIVETDFFNEEITAKLLFPIVDALRYIHQNGVTHRDLKPDNLLYDRKGPDAMLKIADFGMASISSNSFMDTICGSKDYVAPEILSVEPYTNMVDCWSFGVLIYFCLSGKVPFFRGTDEEKFEAIKTCDWDFKSAIWEDISNEAKDLILKLLILEPSQRLNANDIMEHEWFKKFH